MSYLGNEPQFTQYPSKFFNGNGTAQTVALDYAPPNAAAVLVFIDGVRQDTSAYTLAGTNLTFTGSVPSGTNNVQVVHMGLILDVGVPGDGTVTNAKMAANSIDSDQYVDGSIDNAHLADDAVGIDELSATGTASSSTFLRGDNAWVASGLAWQAVVTGATTMVAGRGYFVNTTGSAFSMTLPGSATIGDEVHIIDYAGTFDTNNCTVARNSHKILGATSDLVVATERAAFKLVYVDATQGWLLTEL